MAHDYRYFPDPDLMPVEVNEEWMGSIRETLPETPFDKQRRYFETFDLPYTITSVLVPDRRLCEYFEEAVTIRSSPQPIANWIANDLQRELSAAGQTLEESKVRPAHIAGLVKLVEEGVISSNIAKEVFIEMFQSGKQAEAIVEEKGLKQSTDTSELDGFCDEAIANNPKSVEDFLRGKENAVNFLKGQVMKASRGKANPQVVDQILREKLSALKD